MRVALLSRSAHPLHDPGGLERAVYHLAAHLRALGAEPLLLTRPGARAHEFPGEVLEVPYGRLPGVRHGRVLDRALLYPRFAARLGDRVAELVRDGRVDVVHAQGLTALGYGRLRDQDASLRAPLVMNPQGMEEHKTRGLKRLALHRLRALSREAARLADRVIATDEATRAELPCHLRVAASKVVVLPNGIDADEIRGATPKDPERAAHAALPALAGAFPVFLSVGRLEPYKGFGDVLAALARLHQDGVLPPGWAWVAVGEGSGRAGLERRLLTAELVGRARGRAPLLPHVHMPGRVSEGVLHALYARADVFVHATRFEGSSLVTLEAMAHGLPAVATRAGGIPDKVIDGQTGRLVEPGDVGGLATALAELARDHALRAEMGRLGRARAFACFAWPAIAERTLALYDELLRERSA